MYRINSKRRMPKIYEDSVHGQRLDLKLVQIIVPYLSSNFVNGYLVAERRYRWFQYFSIFPYLLNAFIKIH